MKKAMLYTLAAISIITGMDSCKKTEIYTTPPWPPGHGDFAEMTYVFQCINTAPPYDTTTGMYRWWILRASDTTQAILNFRKNSIYKCQIFEIDEENTDSVDLIKAKDFNINNISIYAWNLTTIIRAEQNENLFCFNMTGGNLVSHLMVTLTDYDSNNPPLPVGLNDNITTSATDSGRMEVVMHHQPFKNGACGEPGSIWSDIFYKVNIK